MPQQSCACALLPWGEDTSLCSSCCETPRAVWLQKLLYKLQKLAPNSCSQLSIWNRASYIYYLDQRDLLFFKGACKCFVASSSYSLPVKFFLQHLFLDFDQKYLRILRVGPGFSTCAAFEKTFSLTAVKDLISVQQLWFFLLQMGTASDHHYNRFGKGIDWKSELQNNANAFNWFWVQGFLKIDYLHFLLLSKFGKSWDHVSLEMHWLLTGFYVHYQFRDTVIP